MIIDMPVMCLLARCFFTFRAYPRQMSGVRTVEGRLINGAKE